MSKVDGKSFMESTAVNGTNWNGIGEFPESEPIFFCDFCGKHTEKEYINVFGGGHICDHCRGEGDNRDREIDESLEDHDVYLQENMDMG